MRATVLNLQTSDTEPAAEIKRRSSNRRDALIKAAAAIFLSDGFASASMRDIAAAAGMKAGSIYYHFPSKTDLFIAVHEEGLRLITQSVEEALVGVEAPWARLETACVAHLEALLTGSVILQAVMRDLPQNFDAGAWRQITGFRDAYEAIFAGLLDDLRLPQGTNRHDLRLMLLGAMNWSFNWYRPGRQTPEALARRYVGFLKTQLYVDE